MTLEKNTANWPECKSYQLDTTTKPKYEDTSSRAAWIKMAAEMPLGSSYVFEKVDEADALVKAIHEVGFHAKTESVFAADDMDKFGNLINAHRIRVFKLDKE